MDENSVQSPGFISRLKNRLSQIDQRTAFDVFLILLIVVGLITSVYLVGQRQIFRSRASQSGSAEVLNQNGEPITTKDEQGNPVVETPQIRLKIDFPTDWNTQSLLPQINSAYAQIESNPETMYCAAADNNRYEGGRIVATCTGWDNKPANSHPWCKGSVNAYFFSSCTYLTAQPTPTPTQPPAAQTCPGQCASPKDQTSAVTINGAVCTSYLGNSAYDNDCRSKNTGYNWCYTSCAQAPTATPTPTQTQTIDTGTSTPSIGTIVRNDANSIIIQGTNFGSGGVVYYSPGGATQNPFSGDVSWGSSGIRILNQSGIPGGYAKVCRSDNKCSPFAPIPDRQATTAQPTPTSTPTQRVGAPPPPPTATPVPEEPVKVRISLVQAYVQKDSQCVRNEAATQDCLEFGAKDPYFYGRGNVADWWLPNQPGTYTIFIGFFSNKGNYKAGPPVKVTYRPKKAERVGGPLAPTPTTTPTATGKECTSDIDPNGLARFCVNSENRDKFKNVCSGGQLNVGYSCPPQFPYCLIGTDVICTPQPSAQPTVQPTPKPIVTCDTLFEDCMKGDLEGTNRASCERMKTQCEELLKTGITPPTPTPTLIPTPGVGQFEFDTSKTCADQQGPCFTTLQQQGLSVTEAADQCKKKVDACYNYKVTQCEEQYSRCDHPGRLTCSIPYQWCKFFNR